MQFIQLTFNSFATEACCDKLTVYDGNTTSSPIILPAYGGLTIPSAVKSTHNSMLVYFHTDNSINSTGWEAMVIFENRLMPTTTTRDPIRATTEIPTTTTAGATTPTGSILQSSTYFGFADKVPTTTTRDPITTTTETPTTTAEATAATVPTTTTIIRDPITPTTETPTTIAGATAATGHHQLDYDSNSDELCTYKIAFGAVIPVLLVIIGCLVILILHLRRNSISRNQNNQLQAVRQEQQRETPYENLYHTTRKHFKDRHDASENYDMVENNDRKQDGLPDTTRKQFKDRHDASENYEMVENNNRKQDGLPEISFADTTGVESTTVSDNIYIEFDYQDCSAI